MKRFLSVLTLISLLFHFCVCAQSNQIFTNGASTTPINFPAGGCSYAWTNSNPGIGLPASGTGNIASFNAVNTGISAVTATIMATPFTTDFAYVTDQGNQKIDVIDLATKNVLKSISAGTSPWAFVITPDGTRVYVTDTNEDAIGEYVSNGSVFVISTETNTVIANIPVGFEPTAIAISPDGKTVYATCEEDDTIYVINVNTNTVATTIAGPYDPTGIVVTPDGKWLYVSNSAGAFPYVYVINTSTNAVSSIIKVPSPGSEQVVISADGSKVYVPDFNGGTVTVISTSTNQVLATISTGTPGAAPYGLCLSADGTKLYVANSSSKSICVINTSTETVATTIPLNGYPHGLSITPDGQQLWVPEQTFDGVVIIDTHTNNIISTITGITSPFAMGQFVSNVPPCPASPISFTITVNPAAAAPPTLQSTSPSGTITACAGTASAAANLGQLTVSGSNLTDNISIAAPNNFQVSTSPNSGFASTLTLAPNGGVVSNTIVYVGLVASASAGSHLGNLSITSPGAKAIQEMVTGIVKTIPTVAAPGNQQLNNGETVTAINFQGTANNYNWTNNTPSIGLAAGGSSNIASFTAINTSANPVVATVTVTPQNVNLLYAANFGANTVSVINPESGSVIGTIDVGLQPKVCVLSPDNATLYVTNENSFSIINAITGKITLTLQVPISPSGMAVSPDGLTLYISDFFTGTVDFFNTGDFVQSSSVSAGDEPGAICVSPDGSLLYVVDYSSGYVTVINTTTQIAMNSIAVGTNPTGLALSADGGTLYVTSQTGNSVSVINTSTNAVTATISVGKSPGAIAVSPDGKLIYVANKTDGTLSVISTSTNTVAATITGFNNPAGLAFNQSGSELFVSNQSGNSISIINTASGTLIGNNATGDQPFGLAYANQGNCPGEPATFTITVNPLATPTITANGTLASLTTVYGTSSASTSFSITGSTLTAGILVTPPAGFEVSTDNNSFSASLTAGTAGQVSATVYIRLAASTPVGSYAGNIVLTSPGAATVNLAMPTGTVTPALLTIIADNKTKPFKAPNPALTASYVGFVNFDTDVQLLTQPVLTTTAVATSAVGAYPIDVSGASSNNYTITYLAGTLTIVPSESSIVIPNTFTPNGDGINDTWQIQSLNAFENCTVDIFTRWGRLVYSSTGYSVPWDGSYKGKALPIGTYYYIINLKNGADPLSGFVAILR